MNCPPFLGREKWGAFFMRVDLRVKQDVEARKAAIGLFELGTGTNPPRSPFRFPWKP